MRWQHHFMLVGVLVLLTNVYWFNVVGGVLFGIGVTYQVWEWSHGTG